jgi:hypothetical protein
MANIIKKDLKLGGDIFWSNSKNLSSQVLRFFIFCLKMGGATTRHYPT